MKMNREFIASGLASAHGAFDDAELSDYWHTWLAGGEL